MDHPFAALPIETPADDPLTALVVQALQHLEADGEEGLQLFCSMHSAERDSILAHVESLRQVGLLHSTSAPEFTRPQRIGDFELLEPLGSGGMGIVYRARQLSLGREVALKLIRPEHLYFPGTRARFEREIRVVARLRHENIVQLFSVGDEGGVPWFAMEHIEGADLAAVLLHVRSRRPQDLTGADLRAAVCALCGQDPGDAETPLPRLFEGGWVRVVLRIAERLADALAHAHAHGVLHRDLKPANVMVTPAGRVVLMDFGLAHTIGDTRITRSGALLGSLQYMAPEQHAREQDGLLIDERTDIFALGVTLYELLALRSPFQGKDSGALLARIREATFRPLAKVHPSISRDVEAICETALAPEPRQRYPSASALARDLRSFLDLRPIAARRAGIGLRLRRWSQRHPAVLAAAMVALLALILAPVELYRRELKVAAERVLLDEARTREWTRARENLELAAAAVDQVLLRVTEDWVADDAESTRVRRLLLDDVAGLLDQLVALNYQDEGLRLGQALSLMRAAAVQRELQDLPRAERYCELALEITEQLEFSKDARAARQRDLVHLQAELGLAGIRRQAGGSGDDKDFAACTRSARDLLAEHPECIEAQRLLAACLQQLASFRRPAPFAADSQRYIDEALALRTTLASTQQRGSDSNLFLIEDRDALVQCHGEAYQCAVVLDDEHGRAEHAGRILELLKAQIERAPNRADPGRKLASWQALLADHALAANEPERAVELATEGMETSARLADRYPAHAELRLASLRVRRTLARALLASKRDADALQCMAESAAALENLLELHPAHHSVIFMSLPLLEPYVAALDERGRIEEADAIARRLEEVVERGLRLFPDRAVAQWHGARRHAILARRLLVRKQAQAALVRIEAGFEILKIASELGRVQRTHVQDATELILLQAEALLQLGEEAKAAALLKTLKKRSPEEWIDAVPALALVKDRSAFAPFLGRDH